MWPVRRRTFLKAGLASAGAYALGSSFWRQAYSAPAVPGPGPYGALLPADANGVMLPQGFTSKILAVGLEPVGDTGYPWHPSSDGAAVILAEGGGWYYAANSEFPVLGGASAIAFDANGEIVDAYRMLTGTSLNCSGGKTPWGTWISGEEHPEGLMWECDPTGPGEGLPLPMLGLFSHEAVTVDPDDKKLYLTEDQTGPDEGDGFYRFTPENYPDLSAGVLEAAVRADDGSVTWVEINPLVARAVERAVAPDYGATPFDGAEGVWYDQGHVYFTTKGDNKVWDLDVAAQRIDVLYDAAQFGDAAPLTGVDNVTRSIADDLYVAEDGGNLEIVIISREGEVAQFLRLPNQNPASLEEGGTELSGVAFDPSGTRFYFSSQRAIPEGFAAPPGFPFPGPGIVYEITGPFRTAAAQTVPTTTTTTAAALPSTGDEDAEGGGLPATGTSAAFAALGAGAAAAAAAIRVATRAAEDTEPT